MSDAIKKLHDYLAMSPSVVYPEDALAYMPAIEDENAKLRELTKEMFHSLLNVAGGRRIMTAGEAQNLIDRMSALGVEVDG